MCKYLSFFVNLETTDIRFWHLESHADTARRHGIRDADSVTCPWVEGHYLPDGTVEVRSPDKDRESAAAWQRTSIIEEWPTFAEFEDYAMSCLRDLRALTVGSRTGPLSRNTVKAKMGSPEYESLFVLDRQLLQHDRTLTADDPRLRYRYRGCEIVTPYDTRVAGLGRKHFWSPYGAHIAALSGNIPLGFKHWRLMCNDTSVAELQLRYGTLPFDFKDWTLPVYDNNGSKTIAHLAALRDVLPPNFNRWLLRDSIHRTVAHVLVDCHGFDVEKYGDLPVKVWEADTGGEDSTGTVLAYWRRYVRRSCERAVPGNAARAFNRLPYSRRTYLMDVPNGCRDAVLNLIHAWKCDNQE